MAAQSALKQSIAPLDDGQFVDTTTGEIITATDINDCQAAPDEEEAVQEIERVPNDDDIIVVSTYENRPVSYVGPSIYQQARELDRIGSIGGGLSPQERTQMEAEWRRVGGS